MAHLLSCQSRLVCPFSYFWFALLTTTPFSTLGDILNSLQTETSFSCYSAGRRKRDLRHGPKQTTMKQPPTLVHGALHKTHVPCTVYWPFLESVFLPPGQVPGKKGPVLAGNNLNRIDKKKLSSLLLNARLMLTLFWYRIPSVFFLWK